MAGRLTRRFVLAAAAATAASAALTALPTPAVAAAEPAKWFLIGNEERCEFIRAADEESAIRKWIIDLAGQDTCEVAEVGHPAPEDCECHPCMTRASVMNSYHVERLDGREKVPVTEYWTEGMGIMCSECDGVAMFPSEGEIVDDYLICNDCLAEARRADSRLREAEAEDLAEEHVGRRSMLPLSSLLPSDNPAGRAAMVAKKEQRK